MFEILPLYLHYSKILFQNNFIDKQEARISLATMPGRDFTLGKSFYLDVARLYRIELQLVGINLVGIVGLHRRIGLGSHFLERLVIIRNRHRNATGIEYPVPLLHTRMQSHRRDIRRFLQVDNGFHVIPVESNPTTGLIVHVTRHAVHQHRSAGKFVLLVDGLQHGYPVVTFDFPEGRMATVRSVQGLSIFSTSVYCCEALVGSLPSSV